MSTFQPGPISVVSIRAEDTRATAHFYRDVIGLRLLPLHGVYPTFKIGQDTHLVIVQGQPAPNQIEPTRFPVLAFAVADLEQAAVHLRTHGVELPWGIESSAQARWVMFYDPAGNLLEFAQFSEKHH